MQLNETESTQQSLKTELDAKKETFELKADSIKKRMYNEGIESVEKSGILGQALNVGDVAPNFKLRVPLKTTSKVRQFSIFHNFGLKNTNFCKIQAIG